MGGYILADIPTIEMFEQVCSVYLTLGVSTSRDGLAQEIIIDLIERDISPERAVDYVIPNFRMDNSAWAAMRDLETEVVEERLKFFDEKIEL